MENGKRDVMMDSQNILDELFFGEDPVYAQLMTATVNPLFSDREEKLIVLLGIFAVKDYINIIHAEAKRKRYMDSLLVPQEGELAH